MFGLRNFRPPRFPTPGVAPCCRRLRPAGKERAGRTSSSHGYEVTAMYGALIESASCIRWFSGFERLPLSKDRTGIRQRAAPQSQFSPPMIWCEHVRDQIAVLRERILVKTTPESYPASCLNSLEPSGDWKLQEGWPDPPPRETLPREIEEKSTGLPVII